MLKDVLTERREAAASRYDDKTRTIMANATKMLQDEGYAEKAANVGFKIPNIDMKDYKGDTISLYDCLKDKLTIISFFRGTWCPYCNFELREYIKQLENESSINLIAISPEKSDVTSETVDIENAPFTILADINNELAEKLNLVFTLPEDLREVYANIGINVEKSQGSDTYKLPLPVTYILDKDATIVKAWVNVDYTYRAEPSEVISEYKKLQ